MSTKNAVSHIEKGIQSLLLVHEKRIETAFQEDYGAGQQQNDFEVSAFMLVANNVVSVVQKHKAKKRSAFHVL